MPGYLIKTANFVAEISNDDELIHLAKVDTIKKDTQICVLPGKTWVEAKKIPILRKNWGLDAGPSVPPPIAMNAQGQAPNSVPAIKTKLPPSLKTEVSANPLMDLAAKNHDVQETEEHVRVLDVCDEELNSEKLDSDMESGCTETMARADSDCQVLDSEVILSVDEADDESLDLRAISSASESSLSFDLDKIQELSTVSHTWELDDGTSTRDLPMTEVEREARELSMQDLDDLSGVELEAAGEQTVAVVRPEIPVVSELEQAVDEIAAEDAVAAEDANEQPRNMSQDEYLEASPDERTYVIESSYVEDVVVPANPEIQQANADCSSIEIDFQRAEKADLPWSETNAQSMEQAEPQVECAAQAEMDAYVGGSEAAVAMEAGFEQHDYNEADEDLTNAYSAPSEQHFVVTDDAQVPCADGVEYVDSQKNEINAQDAADMSCGAGDENSKTEDLGTNTYSERFENVEREAQIGLSVAPVQGYNTIPGIGGIGAPGANSIRPFSPASLYAEANSPVSNPVLPVSAQNVAADNAMECGELGEQPAEREHIDAWEMLINLDAQQKPAESSFDVSGAFDIAQCRIPLDEPHVVVPTSELNVPEFVSQDVMSVASNAVIPESAEPLPFEEPVAAAVNELAPSEAGVNPRGSYSQIPSVDDIDDMFTGMAPQAPAADYQVRHSETMTEPFLRTAEEDYESETEPVFFSTRGPEALELQNNSAYDESAQTKSHIRPKRIAHRSKGTRSTVTNLKELARERRFPEPSYYDNANAQRMPVESHAKSAFEENGSSDYENEFEVARKAVRAAIRAASVNGGVDERILRKAVSFVDAFENSQVCTRDLKHGLGRAPFEYDENCDDNPSDFFRIRSREELELGMKEEMAMQSMHLSETSPTFKRLPNSRPEADECLAFVDEDNSSERFKVRGRSELRRMLVAEEKAAAMDSIPAMNVSTEDLCRKNGGELRKLFEKQDELHLFLGNGIREQEKEFALSHREQEEDRQDSVQRRPEVTQDSVMSGMPKRNSCIVAAPVEKKAPEQTKVLSVFSDEECKDFDVIHPFIDEKLYSGEERDMDFDSLHLTTMRVFSVEVKKGVVTNYEAFDIESIQSFGIHEESRLGLLLAIVSLIFIVSVLLFLFKSYVWLFILIYLGVMLPICYVISFKKTVQFNCSSGRVIRSRCGINNGNRAKAMEFLNRVDAVRQERRRHLNGK